jgi:hypothetical protein
MVTRGLYHDHMAVGVRARGHRSPTNQRSLRTFSTAPDSEEAHAALTTAHALVLSMTLGLGSLSLSMRSSSRSDQILERNIEAIM